MTKASPVMRQGLVVFAKNKKRVSAFYRQTLALEVTSEVSSHDVLQAPGGQGMEVVVHAIPRKYAADIKISKPPEIRESTPFKPTFFVADLEAVRVLAKATGGFLQPLENAWEMNGTRILDGWDPEGNVVQFRQALA